MIIGIDLGTTYSAAAILDGNTARIIPNAEGEDTTPSVVMIDNDEVLVGKIAKARAAMYPDKVRALMKVSMGEKKSLLEYNGEQYSPEMLSGFVIRKLVNDVCMRLGCKSEDAEVVVTVPAYFSEHQRAATKQAVELAGSTCLDMIDEPTAAAIYYASLSSKNDGKYLVYDFGGGTFDATLMEINEDKINIIGKNGVHNAGGALFDEAIRKYVADTFKERTGIDIEDGNHADVNQEILIRAEEVKKALSVARKESILVHAEGAKEEIVITREQFEKMVSPIYRLTESNVKEVLRDNGLKAENIDKVLLVGGSSQIPYVRERLAKIFGEDKLRGDVDPSKAVALGAALYSRMSQSDEKLHDVCSHGIGIVLERQNGGQIEKYNKTLIFKNTPIPTTVDYTFCTTGVGQGIRCTFTEPEFDDEEDLEYCVELGQVDIISPTELAGGEEIVVHITLNKRQMLEGTFSIPSLNYKKAFELKRKNNWSNVELIEMTKVMDSKKSYGEMNNEEAAALDVYEEVQAAIQEKSVNKEKTLVQSNSVKQKNSKRRVEIDTTIAQYFSGIVGMKSVQETITGLYNTLQLDDMRRSRGEKVADLPWNFWIEGEPGSGKSRVCRIITEMLYQFGITEDRAAKEVNVFEVKDDPSILFEVKKDENGNPVEEDDGKVRVYLIDHADQLCVKAAGNDVQEGSNAESPLWIAIYEGMLKRVRQMNRFYIFCGDRDTMDDTWEHEERLALVMRRIVIPEYSVEEFYTIAQGISPVPFTEEAKSKFEFMLRRAMAEAEFANIHSVKNIIDNAYINLSNRTINGDTSSLCFTEEDFFVEDENNETLEELLAKLDKMTGLESVKRDIHDKLSLVQEQEKRRKSGQKTPNLSLNTLFIGSPGTGKTMVAEILAKIYGKLGLLARPDKFVVATASDFKGKYQGHSGPKTREMVKKALGGVLFIDEAYGIKSGENDSFGDDVITELVKLSDEYKHRMIFIMAGYEKEMNDFLEQNSGLSSRFPNKLFFEDYSDEELFRIFCYMIEGDTYNIKIAEEAKNPIKALIVEAKNTKKDFGNARGVRNIVEEMYIAYCQRTANMDIDDPKAQYLTMDDVEIFKKKSKTTAKYDAEKDPMEELEELIGMQSVKDHVKLELDNMIATKKRCDYKNIPFKTDKLHMILVGNAGTGKTTVARIITRIYGKYGLIRDGKRFVEINATNMKAAYVGQTGQKVAELVEQSKGGVLFIDEAYALKPEGEDPFARDAINALLTPIENMSSDLCVIMAGYKDKMEEFLKENQGLKSRMSTMLEITDYTIDELTEIFYRNVGDKDDPRIISEELRAVVKEKLKERQNTIEDFGNARGAVNYYKEVAKRQRVRAYHSGIPVESDDFITILEEDL